MKKEKRKTILIITLILLFPIGLLIEHKTENSAKNMIEKEIVTLSNSTRDISIDVKIFDIEYDFGEEYSTNDVEFLSYVYDNLIKNVNSQYKGPPMYGGIASYNMHIRIFSGEDLLYTIYLLENIGENRIYMNITNQKKKKNFYGVITEPQKNILEIHNTLKQLYNS